MSTQPGAHRALTTDLYQLTMAAGYFIHGEHEKLTTTFDLFVRRLPANRGFLVVAGLEDAIRYLTELSFTGPEIDFLRALPVFQKTPAAFWDYLKSFRFTGEVSALPEGTICFAGEPMMRVRAPIIEAQIVETYLLAVINFQTLIATKAARCVMAAQGRDVVEFGLRRAHGPEAGTLAARAAYLGGVVGTSNVEAAMRYKIPVSGTAAHAWTMAHNSEEDAFSKYVEAFPAGATLLIDTYDTLRGARRAAVFKDKLKGVRLDSGDLHAQSLEVRKILDDAGCQKAKIVASGDLNEFSITELISKGAKIDTFGVGTDLVTSRDAPALGGVYKLVEQEVGGQKFYRAKFSAEKASWPGAKQVYRFTDELGNFSSDLLALSDEPTPPNAIALSVDILHNGKLIRPLDTLEEARSRCLSSLPKLPESTRLLKDPTAYPVKRSAALEALFAKVKEQMLGSES
jgi:nicotinate phosphoribosyltransferase